MQPPYVNNETVAGDLLGTLDDLPKATKGRGNDKGKATRFKDVGKAHGLFITLQREDELSLVSRSRVDAMFDGTPPYDPGILKSTGQGSRTNLNFGEAQRYLDIAMSAFVDLFSSLERLVQVKLDKAKLQGLLPEASETYRLNAEEIIADEITVLLRGHPEFHSNYQRLCTEFTKHGVGITYFDNPDQWKFRVGGFNDFLIPRQCPSSEERIEVGFGRRDYMVHELYGFIKDEEKAKKLGWDVEETRRVILKTTRTSPGFDSNTDWDRLEREIKNNDVTTGSANSTVEVVHMWGREYDGTISHFIFSGSDPKKWMFSSPSRFKAAEQAFIFFTYGVGTNGTFHSIRGMGTRIFPHVQTLNRLRCSMADGAMLASGVMIQPESERALQNLSFSFFGPFSVLGPNVNVVEKAIPNLTQNAQPVIQDMEGQLAANVDLSTIYKADKGGSPYRNNLQVEHDLAVNSHLTGATLNLFYMSWVRLMREVTRRIVSGKDKSPEVGLFFRRCHERGVPKEVIEMVLPDRTSAPRAIGSGSQANRVVALRELNGISGSFDEVGRRNLTRDIVVTRAGLDLADRYAPANPEPRLTVDAKVAMLENNDLEKGAEIPVLDGELHGMHLMYGHVPAYSKLLAAVQEGQIDPVESFVPLQSFYNHVQQHLGYLALDPAAQAEVAQVKQLQQVGEEWIINTGRKIQKMQRDARQSQEEGGEVDPKAQAALAMRVQEHEIKMEIAKQKAQLDMRIREAKAKQEMILNDARTASELNRSI